MKRLAELREFLEACVEVLAALEKIRIPDLAPTKTPAASVDE